MAKFSQKRKEPCWTCLKTISPRHFQNPKTGVTDPIRHNQWLEYNFFSIRIYLIMPQITLTLIRISKRRVVVMMSSCSLLRSWGRDPPLVWRPATWLPTEKKRKGLHSILLKNWKKVQFRQVFWNCLLQGFLTEIS